MAKVEKVSLKKAQGLDINKEVDLQSSASTTNVVNQILKRNNIADVNVNQEVDIKQQVEDIKERNARLLLELQDYGVSEKEIDEFNDNRNFIQKFLGLKENQGLLSSVLDLLNRPAEATQGALSAIMTGQQDVLINFWKGLSGQETYSVNDLGINVDEPLLNAVLGVAFEVGIDPLNFLDKPLKLFATKSKDIFKQATTKLKSWMGKSELGDVVLEKTILFFSKLENYFKTTFGTWTDVNAKQHLNDVSLLRHDAIRLQQEGQKLVKEIYDIAGSISDDIIEGVVNNTLTDDIRKWLKDEVLIGDDVLIKLNNPAEEAYIIGKEELVNKLNTYYGRLIEENFKHGYTVKHFFEEILDDGIIEVAAKSVDEVLQGNIYKKLEQVLKYALSRPRVAKYNIDDLIRVEKEINNLTHLGKNILDSNGNILTNAKTSLQGFRITLTDIGQEVLRPYWNDLVRTKTVKDFIKGTKITKEQDILTSLLETGEVVIAKLDADGLKVIERVKQLYKKATGRELEIIQEPFLSGVKLNFAPTKKAYDEYKEIKQQIDVLVKQEKKIHQFFKDMDRARERIVRLTLSLEQNNNLIWEFINKNKKSLKINPEDLWKQDATFNEYLKAMGIKDLADKRVPYFKPKKATKRAYGYSADSFDKWLPHFNRIHLRGVKFDIPNANIIGNQKSVGFDFKFDKLSTIERINLVVYMLDRGVLGYNDLINLGFRSFDDFNDIVKMNRLNKIDLSLMLSQESGVGFLNLAEWIKYDIHIGEKWITQLIKQRFANIYAGDMINSQIILELTGVFSKQTAIELLHKKVQVSKAKRYETLKTIFEDNDVLKKKVLTDYQFIGNKTKSPEFQRFSMYQSFFENGMVIDDKSISRLMKRLDKKGITLNDVDIEKNLKTLQTNIKKEMDGVLSSMETIKNRLKTKRGYFFSTNKFENYAKKLDLDDAYTMVSQLTSASRKIDFFEKQDVVYVVVNSLNQPMITNVYSPELKHIVLDYSDYLKLREYQTEMINLSQRQEQLLEIQDAHFEAMITSHCLKYPEFKFNHLELNDLLLELRVKWNNEVIEKLLSSHTNTAYLKTQNFGKNKVIQQEKLKVVQQEIKDINQELTKIQKELDTNKDVLIKKDLLTKKRILQNRKQELSEMQNQVQKRIKSAKRIKDKLIYPEKKVKNFTNETIQNINNQQWVPTDSLSGVDYINKAAYSLMIQRDLTYLKELLDYNKVESLRTISSMGGYDNAFSRIPELFQNSIDRLVNVQFTIHNSIARNFKYHFGIDMTNWGVNGYLRHMLSPEMANLAMITNTIKGRLSGTAGEFFGHSAKQIAMFREYQGSAADVNLMKANDLFNTNPIEATAIALDLLPRNFHLGGVFKSMIENNLIKEVGLSSYEVSYDGAISLQKRIQKQIEQINSTKKISEYQKQKLAGLNNELKQVEDYLQIYQKQKKFIKENFPNKLSQEDFERLQKLNQEINQLKDAKKQADTLNTNSKNISAEIKRKIEELNKFKKTKGIDFEISATVKQEYEEITNQLSIASRRIQIIQAKGFNGNDSWLKELEGFGKEYQWITREMFVRIQEAFEIVSKASGEYDAIYNSDWGKQISQIIENFENNNATYAIHRSVYDSVVRLSKQSVSGDAKSIWRTLEKTIVRPFKQLSVATVGFHIRNLFTNLSNAYLAGFNPADMIKEMSIAHKELKVFNKTLEDITKLLATGRYREAEQQIEMISDLINKGIKIDGIDIPFDALRQKVFQDYFDMLSKGVIGNNHFSNDLAIFIGNIRDKALGRELRGTKLYELNKTTKYFGDKAKTLMNKLFEMSKNADDIAKVAMYRLANSKKYKHLLVGTYNTPEKLVKFVLFDYNNLTHTEETVMKALFPFYIWARKNLEFQMKNFLKNNKRYRWLHNALVGWREGLTFGLEENEYNDQYFPVWNEDGTITYVKIQPQGWLAADDILMGTGIINALTPILKAPIEMITGYDFFTRKSFNDSGQFYGFGLGLTNLINTFDIALKTMFNSYVPTYDDKKVAGILGKKIIQLAEMSKGLFSFTDLQNFNAWNQVIATFPSVFSQDNLYQLLYYQERERNELMYKILNQKRKIMMN